ncbi:hypothetical protein PGT21_022080 [Puccinia graminis f. sp. tritici]|uniref:Uncharacterized protein n=1 Tax=Puccinia graminis f. sp. tritici TaxID=56615 RepID=A0A5B0QKL3_PUCGR|nr:hypothetical protein PGT21_021032 [Puccinia graminis f. sp. tritici]KAA1113128.1 hypothetical protein PGT21_022080 [Puccinia graminis f. sp. tritici]KAA1113700.1 hypothetical protein PGTUg99_022445 [Puccinia graminis f. sp. tritici]KAA1131865.1 hypothetical protein PGTUg99_031167 [Puccinia graminis f. sp. tritici]
MRKAGNILGAAAMSHIQLLSLLSQYSENPTIFDRPGQRRGVLFVDNPWRGCNSSAN